MTSTQKHLELQLRIINIVADYITKSLSKSSAQLQQQTPTSFMSGMMKYTNQLTIRNMHFIPKVYSSVRLLSLIQKNSFKKSILVTPAISVKTSILSISLKTSII